MPLYPPPPKLFAIKAARVRGPVLIFTDEDGYVWVMGTNNYRKSLGVNTSEVMTEPARTTIKLSPGETVIQAYHHNTLFSIHTSHQRLFLSRIMNPIIFNDPYTGPIPSVNFATTAGFIEPLLEIDEVLNIGETMIFRRGQTHYLYNWRLSITDTSTLKLKCLNTNIDSHITFALTMHHYASLFCYRLCLPFEVTMCEYGRNYIHMCSGLNHHILSLPTITVNEVLAWRCFETEVETVPDYIYVSSSYPHLLVIKDGVAFDYDRNCNILQRVISDSWAVVLNQDEGDEPIPAFATPEGTLTSYGGYEFCAPGDLINNVISIVDNYASGITFLMVDVDSPESYAVYNYSLCINVRLLVWHQLVFNGVLTYGLDGEVRLYTAQTFGTDPVHMELITAIPVTTHRTFSIYRRVEHLQGQVIVQASSSVVLFRTALECHAYWFDNGEPNLYEEITLEHKDYTEIELDLIEYPRIRETDNKHFIFTNPYEGHLSMFTTKIMEVPPRSNLEVMYCVGSTIVAVGDGVRREFIESALSQFIKYLIRYGFSTVFNLSTFADKVLFMPFTLGYMLHAAITLLQNCLPFHLPISVLASILQREPSDSDLEALAFQQNPEAFLKIYPFKHHSNFEDFGYASYTEALRALVHYVPLDAPLNARTTHISRQIAYGMANYSHIEGIEDMNFVTLDYYLSGEYSIPRSDLKSRINGPELLVKWVYEVIEYCTDEQLSSFLRNWTGSSTLLDVPYQVVDGSDGIKFHACFYIAELSTAFIEERLRSPLKSEPTNSESTNSEPTNTEPTNTEPTNSEPTDAPPPLTEEQLRLNLRHELIDMLTTPINIADLIIRPTDITN